MHIHAFSPLEVMHGAETLNLTVSQFLGKLQEAGLKTLPGTAAEILSDDIRALICPDKLNTEQWLNVVASATNLVCQPPPPSCLVMLTITVTGQSIC